MYRDTTNFTTPANPVESKPDVFSLEGLIAWLEKQPATDAYDYCKSGNCLLAQYFKANGIADAVVVRNFVRDAESTHREFPMAMKDAAHGNKSMDELCQDDRWTIGRALTRARRAV